ncbi:hypothetical protein CAter282_2383 [Collimonas arenae]|uniref:Uncharacterized protein n=1 Tax=Collimonas arenae TaxID=279058 RepID=A0A127QJ86_9BURK|nr:hypothetical protein CAter10_2624 [Collimonas arenae]AMP10129.1 hypothetical protein CAter282_2383 [Collimonas arenae]
MCRQAAGLWAGESFGQTRLPIAPSWGCCTIGRMRLKNDVMVLHFD